MQGHYQPPEKEESPLDKFTINFTSIAKNGKIDPVIGRNDEVRRVIQILSRRSKNNPVLLGDPGVGKTAIVEGLAQRIIDGDVPETLRYKQVISLDIASLLAGASYRGEFEKRFKSLIDEIEKNQGKYILFIDELHTIVGAGGAEGAVDAGNMLKPSLARGKLQTIGATTVREYRQYIEKDPALERRFQPVYVDEPTVEDSISILRGIKEKYEVHHGIKISDNAVIAAVNLSSRYITDRFLPDKAIDLMDEAAASAKIEVESMPAELDEIKRKLTQIDIELAALKKEKNVEARQNSLQEERDNLDKKYVSLFTHWKEQKKTIKDLQKIRVELDEAKAELEKTEREVMLDKAAELKYGKIPQLELILKQREEEWKKIPENDQLLREQVTEEDIAEIISKWTGIPTTRLLSSESQRLAHLENEMKEIVIGQNHALEKVAKAIRRTRAGLAEENRPIGSFLFLGPTGVGKTETAKALAYSLFNDKNAMIRIDMSEYQEAHNISRLIGAPPGYIGYEEGGQLTEAVRRKPYSVILFDEIEKANSQVFHIFLQILDEGHITDGRGRKINMKNTIIIFTSNIGSEIYGKIDDIAEREKQILDKVQNHFKPEMINRLDSIIIFNQLDETIVEHIVEIQLNNLSERLHKQKLTIEFSKEIKAYLKIIGFDSVYGARPLKRVINEVIVDEISLQIIEGKVQPMDHLIIDIKNNSVHIEIKKPSYTEN